MGGYSKALREEVALFGEWMANDTPPWTAIWVLLIGRLLGMNKFLGVRPLGCGEAWRRLLAKCVLAVTMTEAELECGIDQLSRGFGQAPKEVCMPCAQCGIR